MVRIGASDLAGFEHLKPLGWGEVELACWTSPMRQVLSKRDCSGLHKRSMTNQRR